MTITTPWISSLTMTTIMKQPHSCFPSLPYIRKRLMNITYMSNVSQTEYKKLRINWSMPRLCKGSLITTGTYGLQFKELEQKTHTGDWESLYCL
jgi:hypothetical protein